jgi:hypothetical protein
MYMLGADADDLNRIYDVQSRFLDPWSDSPGEISSFDWRDYLGKRELSPPTPGFFALLLSSFPLQDGKGMARGI